MSSQSPESGNTPWPERLEQVERERDALNTDVLTLAEQAAIAEEQLGEVREALRTIDGPSDSGPWILIYREAGGGYEGLQAIARAVLAKLDSQSSTKTPEWCKYCGSRGGNGTLLAVNADGPLRVPCPDCAEHLPEGSEGRELTAEEANELYALWLVHGMRPPEIDEDHPVYTGAMKLTLGRTVLASQPDSSGTGGVNSDSPGSSQIKESGEDVNSSREEKPGLSERITKLVDDRLATVRIWVSKFDPPSLSYYRERGALSVLEQLQAEIADLTDPSEHEGRDDA